MATLKFPVQKKPSDQRLYTLEVRLVGGLMTEEFAKKNKLISRTIQIRGDQTLGALHKAIFDAFDREEEHMYEFQIGGKKPMDRKARRYVLPMDMEDSFGDSSPAGVVTRTLIGSLGFTSKDVFYYWFDFGDDWWHEIRVAAIEDDVPKGRYPKVVQRVGESPPQYIDWDEDE